MIPPRLYWRFCCNFVAYDLRSSAPKVTTESPIQSHIVYRTHVDQDTLPEAPSEYTFLTGLEKAKYLLCTLEELDNLTVKKRIHNTSMC